MQLIAIYYCALCALSLLLVNCNLVATNNFVENEQTTFSEDLDYEEDWDYEPRLWSPPATSSVEESLLIDDDEHSSREEGSFEVDSNESSKTSLNSIENLNDLNFNRNQNYFINQRQNVTLKQQQRQDFDDQDEGEKKEKEKEKEDECTQFKVDTREAVICDITRCDKFDFEWPKYENQIVLIQTTKHGMRFHRSDFTFNRKFSNNHHLRAPISTEQGDYDDENKNSKIKFDLLELFKPSTEASTTTTTTSTTTTTTTSAPATTSTASPSSTEAAVTTTTTTATTTTAASTTTTSGSVVTTFVPYPFASTTRQPPIDTAQDSNDTQLVTTFRTDTRRTKQKMIGFGGALSDSTCRNIKSLSPEMARNLMEDYYGDRGLRYNIARLSIGSSDFSTTPYTNNDRQEVDGSVVATTGEGEVEVERKSSAKNAISDRLQLMNEKDDVEMNNFHLTNEDYDFKLPIARQAISTSRQEVRFFSSLWSPPIWMKNNSHIVHGYLKGDVYGPYYKALAELIIKWLEAYRKNGIEFWATTGLNEPVTGVKPFIFHNSLGITKSDYKTFFKLYLGPMMRQRGFQNVKLIMLDDNKGYAPNWVREMLEDQEVSKYVSGIAFHWYMNDEYENLNFLVKNYPDKFIISSEACNGFLPFQLHPMPGDWDRGVAYMFDILKIIQKNAAAWIDWNMALDLNGGPSWANNNLDAPIIVNSARDEYYKSPMFYALGHFSKFVERDSMRLDYLIANAKFDYPVEAVAFLTPKDYIVIVALNANRYQVPFKVIVNKQLVKTLTLRADSFNTILFKWKRTKLQ